MSWLVGRGTNRGPRREGAPVAAGRAKVFGRAADVPMRRVCIPCDKQSHDAAPWTRGQDDFECVRLASGFPWKMRVCQVDNKKRGSQLVELRRDRVTFKDGGCETEVSTSGGGSCEEEESRTRRRCGRPKKMGVRTRSRRAEWQDYETRQMDWIPKASELQSLGTAVSAASTPGTEIRPVVPGQAPPPARA